MALQNITRPVVTGVVSARTDAVSVTGSPLAMEEEESAMVVLVANCAAPTRGAVHTAAMAKVTEIRTNSG